MDLPKYCLDTHPLIWYFLDQKTLSSEAKKILDQAFLKKINIYIPSIVILEAFHLGIKNKAFIFSDFFRTLKIPNIIIVPFDKTVLTTCFTLPKNLNIHDRIICATALATKSILVTKDRIIRKASMIKSVW